MRSRKVRVLAVVVGLATTTTGIAPALAAPPGLEVALQAAVTDRRELDATDVAASLRLSWRPIPWVALDAELGLAPGDLGGARAFSGSRKEVSIGLRNGPDLSGSGPYWLIRGGIVRFGAAPRPLPCILIFPPPLTCSLAAGDDLTAIELGVGYQRAIGERARLLFELRDQIVRYEGPALDADFEPHPGSFWSHNPRLVLGLGWAF